MTKILKVRGFGGMIWRAIQRRLRRKRSAIARAIWDDFGGECGNDSDYCRWTGDRDTVGKCYCQKIAWRHADLAQGKPSNARIYHSAT